MYHKEDFMKYKGFITLCSITALWGIGAIRADATTSSLKSCEKKVTATRTFKLYEDSKLKKSSTKDSGTVYDVDGYRMINGKKYYRVYQSNKYKGYIKSSDFADLKAVKYGKDVTLTKDDYTRWKTLYYSSKKGTTKKGDVYYAKYYYKLGNGKKYYSLYRKDSKNRDIWQGYVNVSGFQDLKYKSEGKKVGVLKDYTEWKNFYFSIKKGTTKSILNKEVTAKGSYTLGNGKKYYSIYDSDNKWLGYVNISAFVEKGNVAYYSSKNITDTQGTINNTYTTIYSSPLAGSNKEKGTTKSYYKKQVIYTEDAYTPLGNYVKTYLLENGKKGKYLGWINRQSIYNNEAPRKLADKSKNYGVWNEPYDGSSKRLASMSDFNNSYVQQNQSYVTPQGKTYVHIIANGGDAGWVEKGFVKKNSLVVSPKVSLVHSYEGGSTSWNTNNAVSEVSDKSGNMIDPTKVRASQSTISTDKAGKTIVTYTYGDSKATSEIMVRNNPTEGSLHVAATPANPSNTNWVQSQAMLTTNSGLDMEKFTYQNSVGYDPTKGKYIETKANTYIGGNPQWKFTTRLFTPLRVSAVKNTGGETTIPQGLAVIGDWAYGLYLQDAHDNHGFIIGYNMKKMGSLGDLRQLPQLARNDYNRYKEIVKNMIVGPVIYTEHGQGLTTDGKNLYLAATKLGSSSDMQQYNTLLTISDGLTVSNYETYRVAPEFSSSTKRTRTFYNIAMKNDHSLYAVFDYGEDYASTPGQPRYGIFEITKQDNGEYLSKRVMTMTTRVGKTTPIQGFAYNRQQDAVYIATDDAFAGFKLPTSNTDPGKLLSAVKLNAQRETEGIAFSADGEIMYMGMNRGGEILSAVVK